VAYVVLAVVVVVIAIVAAIFWYFGIRKGCRIDPFI
jgi:hypothetical protein